VRGVAVRVHLALRKLERLGQGRKPAINAERGTVAQVLHERVPFVLRISPEPDFDANVKAVGNQTKVRASLVVKCARELLRKGFELVAQKRLVIGIGLVHDKDQIARHHVAARWNNQRVAKRRHGGRTRRKCGWLRWDVRWPRRRMRRRLGGCTARR